MADKDTISMHLVREALAQALPIEQHAAWLADAGIAPGSERVPAACYGALWRAVALHLDDEFFGMDARGLRVGSLGFLLKSAMAQPRVHSGLEQACEFAGLMLAGLRPHLAVHGSLATVTLEQADAAPPARPFACFTLWMILHGALCWLAGQRVPILAVALRAPAPGYLDDYRRFFGEQLAFGQASNRLVFPAQCLPLPVRRDHAQWQAFMDQAPGNLLVKYRDPSSLARQVRVLLANLAPADWPEAAPLAASLGMSPATLRRRLAEQGERFQALKDSVRQELALAWLAREGLSIEAVAEGLGFADGRSFYRAFRKWYGCNPGHYRQLMQGTGRTAQPR
ncbi:MULTISPECIES: AraC family transcriptional regulator [unclassified Pseudomonas]|uniref:AraC family transcriptional regulator n=1 Tax=unclassified Pseudomonas TaxID=196821 RepID=UPI000BE3F60B|nr:MULTISPECIES: AraC family transcriptional regulator [unclassified Pseudomonas]